MTNHTELGPIARTSATKASGATHRTAIRNVSPMAAQYRCSVDIFTSPPASNLLTTEAEVPIRAATIP